ncbi:MAG: putative peptidoglycan glycosyltransferase FtsW [bacterium]
MDKSHSPDYSFIITAGAIILFGLIMLSSAGVAISYKQFNDGYYFLKHQITFGLMPGIFLFYVLSRIDYKVWKKFAFLILIFSIAMLLLVFTNIGTSLGTNAQSWIKIAGISFQPSEFVKLTFLIYLASWLSKKDEKIIDFTYGLLPFILLLGTIVFLVLPDTGTMIIILSMSFIVYFAAGASMLHLAGISGIGVILLYILIKFKPYRMARFMTFLHPEIDPQGIGYHINQALLAIGSGGFWGKGFGHSRQKFLYLPLPVNDSIFAIIAEEMGFFVVAGLILGFLFLFYKGIQIAKKAPDEFGKLLGIGIMSWIIIQTFINISGMIGLLPMTGVPLPLVSYGGSALMTSMAGLGIMVNISKQTVETGRNK